ncbi:MAG: hypothetical protein K2G49_10275 [Muribaculum sp.]|nr:hypothetical protein [Muribaculum sp.]
MKRILFFIVLAAISASIYGQQAKSASQVMDSAAKKIQSIKSLSATYDMVADGEHMSGTLVMSGDKFHLSSDQIMAWYDGKTQWSYSADTNEVNVIEPTPEELVAINPFVIISSFKKAYTPSLLHSAAGTYKIHLVPKTKKGSPITDAVLTLSAKSYLPSNISLTLDTGSKLDIRIKSIKSGTNYPHSTFVFNKKQLPGAVIVDLR